MTLKLKDIIWIRELVPQESVECLTRQRVMPLDIFEIEGIFYRINFMEQIKDDWHFTAIKK